MKQLIYIPNALKTACLFLLISSISTIAASNASPEARFRLIKMEYTLLPNGGQEYHFRKELTLFTHTAMNNTYGETFIIYNPHYQELKINEAYTRQKDGTLIQTPANAFVKQLPYSAAKAPAFNHLIEMVIIHTGLELGATLYLDYTLTTKPGYLPELDICRPIRQTSPVDQCEITLSVPSEKEIHYYLSDHKGKPLLSNQDGMQNIHWTLSDLPASSREINPSAEHILTANTWRNQANAVEYIGNQCTAPQSMALQNKTNALIDTIQNDSEKINTLLRYVMTEIDNCPLTLQETGYRIRPVEEILRTAYATEAEKANLLYGMFRISGLSASLQLIGRLPQSNDATAGLAAIRNIAVYTQNRNYPYIINPVSGFLYPATEKKSELFTMCWPEKSESLTPTVSQKCTYDATITFEDQEKVMVKSKQTIPYTLAGVNNKKASLENGYCIINKSEELPIQILDSIYLLLTLPEPATQYFQNQYAIIPTHRISPMSLSKIGTDSLHYTIQLPKGYSMLTPTKETIIRNAIGELDIIIRPTSKGIELIRKLQVQKTILDPKEDYPAFRALISMWNDPKAKQLILSRETIK